MSLFVKLSLALACAGVSAAPPPPRQEPGRGKLSEFVDKRLAGQSASSPVTFDGFAPLPPELARRAERAFPKHRFAVAKLTVVMGLNPYRTHLLIVTDAETGEVVAHLYDLVGAAPAPESFRNLLSSYRPRTRREAVEKVQTLARLIGYPHRPVGEARLRNGAVEAAVYWGRRPWRIVRTSLDRDLRFGRLLFINPVSGKDWDEQAKELLKEYGEP